MTLSSSFSDVRGFTNDLNTFISTRRFDYSGGIFRNGFGGMNRDTALYTEYKGKPHVDMSGLGGSCAVTKNHPYVEITKEFREAEKTR
jgi:hypothetical protein